MWEIKLEMVNIDSVDQLMVGVSYEYTADGYCFYEKKDFKKALSRLQGTGISFSIVEEE